MLKMTCFEVGIKQENVKEFDFHGCSIGIRTKG